MAKISKIPATDQKCLLSKKDELPPRIAGLSEDGISLWKDLERHYRLMHLELESYFKGEFLDLSHLPDNQVDFLEAKRDWFLRFYDLIRQSWLYLENYHVDENGDITTPGKLAARILEIDCYASLLPITGNHVVIDTRFNYDLPQKLAKVDKKSEKYLNQLSKDCFRKWGDYQQYAAFEVGIVQRCRLAAKKDRRVKKLLKAYLKAQQELSEAQYKLVKPRRKQEIWHRGSRKSA